MNSFYKQKNDLREKTTNLTAIMTTIMIGKMETAFPDMYMTNMFMGACLRGPKARSQDLLALKFVAVESRCK